MRLSLRRSLTLPYCWPSFLAAAFRRAASLRLWTEVAAARFLLALVCACVTPVHAGPLEDAQAAYDRGKYALAIELWQPLAEQGNPAAQAGLGGLYLGGYGVARDEAVAMAWFARPPSRATRTDNSVSPACTSPRSNMRPQHRGIAEPPSKAKRSPRFGSPACTLRGRALHATTLRHSSGSPWRLTEAPIRMRAPTLPKAETLLR